MKFHEALKQLFVGFRVRLCVWQKDEYIELVPGDSIVDETGAAWSILTPQKYSFDEWEVYDSEYSVISSDLRQVIDTVTIRKAVDLDYEIELMLNPKSITVSFPKVGRVDYFYIEEDGTHSFITDIGYKPFRHWYDSGMEDLLSDYEQILEKICNDILLKEEGL